MRNIASLWCASTAARDEPDTPGQGSVWGAAATYRHRSIVLRQNLGQQTGPREHWVVPGRRLHHAIRPLRVFALRLGTCRHILGPHHIGRGSLPPRPGVPARRPPEAGGSAAPAPRDRPLLVLP